MEDRKTALGIKRHKKRFRKRIVGAPPGTITADPLSAKPVIRVLAFNPQSYTECVLTDLKKVAEFRNK